MLVGISRVRCLFSLTQNLGVLGLKTTARMEDVKKKYYELAKQYHPDMNSDNDQAHKKFTQLTKAYKYVLDNFGQDHSFYDKVSKPKGKEKPHTDNNSSRFKSQKQYKTRMEQDQYEDFFQQDVFFKGAKKFRKPKVGEDIYVSLKLNLNESVVGAQKTVEFSRYEVCGECRERALQGCFSCGGKGQVYDRQSREKVRCERCSGRGFKNECLECMGAGYVLKEAKEKLYVQKGTHDKTILKMQRMGHGGFKAHNGDLYITVVVEQSQKFKVDGNNIHSEHELDYVTATCGGITSVETVHGQKQVKISAGTQSGSELRIFNYGLKSPYSKRMGDQIVKIKIKIPQKMSQKQKRLMERLASQSK